MYYASPLDANEPIGRPVDKRHERLKLYFGECDDSTAQLGQVI